MGYSDIIAREAEKLPLEKQVEILENQRTQEDGEGDKFERLA